jgi:hypothetical protein
LARFCDRSVSRSAERSVIFVYKNGFDIFLSDKASYIVSGRPRKMDNRPRAAVTWRARSSSDSIINWNAFELKYGFCAPCLGSKTNNGTTVLEALDASINPVLSLMRKSLLNKKMDLP